MVKRKRDTDKQVYLREARKRARTDHGLGGKAMESWANSQWNALTPAEKVAGAQRARDAVAAGTATAAGPATAPGPATAAVPETSTGPFTTARTSPAAVTATAAVPATAAGSTRSRSPPPPPPPPPEGPPRLIPPPPPPGSPPPPQPSPITPLPGGRPGIFLPPRPASLAADVAAAVFVAQNTPDPRGQAAGEREETAQDIGNDGDTEKPPNMFRRRVRLDHGERTVEDTDRYRRQAKLLAPSWPLGVTWTFVQHLGGGGFGQAHLYVQLDQENRIVERIVIKDSWMISQQWGNVRSWHGNPRDIHDRRVTEVKVLENMLRNPGSDKVVQIRHAKLRPYSMRYRIYMSYHGRGTLSDLIGLYNPARVDLRDISTHRIPEPAVWAIFHALTQACLLMEFGGVEDDEKRPGWASVIHCDIKPANVFLDEPDPDCFPLYPKAVLGDFGLAVITNRTDPMNPSGYNGGEGTLCFRAPEMLSFVDQETLQPMPQGQLGSHTNVWGIGATMARLMNLQTSSMITGPLYMDGYERYEWLSEGTRQFYSEPLCNLVERCTYYNITARIALRQLRGDIDQYTLGLRGHHDCSGGARHMTQEDKEHWPYYAKLVLLPEDPFREGMFFNPADAEPLRTPP